MLSRKKHSFLKDRIHRISDVILHCPEDDFFNLQSVEAQVLHIDERGYLWLAVEPPADCLQNALPSFDVVINYQQHGVEFDMDILGEAVLFSGSGDEIDILPNKARKELTKGRLLLEVHIIDIDYRQQGNNILKNAALKMRQLFAAPTVEEEKEPVYSNQ
ncbi:MAG: hypothetical protein QM726_20145 [Chitinophagaceae bacterium]